MPPSHLMYQVRVETCGCADGFAKEATEIQNIQVADGDVPHGLPVQCSSLRLRIALIHTYSDSAIYGLSEALYMPHNRLAYFQDRVRGEPGCATYRRPSHQGELPHPFVPCVM